MSVPYGEWGQEESFCANGHWYGWETPGVVGGFKLRMSDLVGWSRKDHPVLDTSKAYDTAYQVLYWDSLPACRNCMCFPFGLVPEGNSSVEKETA